jgi:hypothetical protein
MIKIRYDLLFYSCAPAKFYELTRAGRRQVTHESADWERTVALMERFLRVAE